MTADLIAIIRSQATLNDQHFFKASSAYNTLIIFTMHLNCLLKV